MNNKRLRKIALCTITFVIIMTSMGQVAFAQSEEQIENVEEIEASETSLEEVEELEEHDDFEHMKEVEDILENESEELALYEEDNDPQYYIKDPVLREIINKRLYKEEGYNPTPTDLESITFLQIEPQNGSGYNSRNYLRIDSFEGFEYLVNLNYLIIKNTIMDERDLETIAMVTSLISLDIEYSFFTGRNDVSTTLLNTSINGASRTDVDLAFSSYVSLEPLSNLTALTQIQLVRNATINDRTEFGKTLTGYDLTGWEKLVNLEYIWIEGASSFNDNSFGFIKELPEITEITLYNTSLNSLEHFADLSEEKMRVLQVMSNDVLDYTPVIDKSFFINSSLNVVKDLLGFYTEEEVDGETGKYVSVNTGIKVSESLAYVTVSSYSMFRDSMEYLGYEIHEGILYLNFKVLDLVDFKHISIEEKYHGFMVNVEVVFNTPNGIKDLEFDLPINIGKRVDFVLSSEDVQSLYFKPFEAITPLDNPSRPGFHFVGWTEDLEGMIPYDFSKETFDNQRIYAQWEELDSFTVSFNTNGGSEVSPIHDVKKDTTIDEPMIPIKDGYVFAGWFKDMELNDQWDFKEDRVSEDIILHAKWELVNLDIGQRPTSPSDNSTPDHTSSTETNTPMDSPNTGLKTTESSSLIAMMLVSLLSVFVLIRKRYLNSN